MCARVRLMTFVLCLIVCSTAWTNNEAPRNADGLSIIVTSMEANYKILKIDYEVINNSRQEIWICDSVDALRWIGFEVYLSEDGKTLMIRKRLDVPTTVQWQRPPYGRYVRLKSGKKRTESLLLSVPVESFSEFNPRRALQSIEYATRLAIEIGYYEGNLPEMIFKMLEEAEKIGNKNNNEDFNIIGTFGTVLNFNYNCERLRQRDEEVVIPYTHQKFKGEKILRTTIDNLHIPYGGKPGLTDEEAEIVFEYPPPGPDLTSCTKVEIEYQPSMLDFFFPFEGQQSLLSDKETEYLQSEKTIVVENSKDINTLAQEISKGTPDIKGIVRQRSVAQVACYRENEHLMTLPIIYNDFSILTTGKFRFIYKDGLQSLRILTPQIQQIELRVDCAAHMKNLWYRLRLYSKRLKDSSNKNEVIYPAANEWCDAIVKPYSVDKYFFHKFDKLPHVVSKTNELKSYYAMNPNCEPNSPGDMVLLFETKAGWNQHGGPELFTFANHDPKGGCVLLNDGTVKFIRTEDELNDLRWK